MKANVRLLFLFLSFTTAMTLLPSCAAKTDTSQELRRSRRMEDVSRTPVPEDVKRARMARIRTRGAEAAQPVAPRQTPQAEIDPARTSDDPTFGYTLENPVKLGGADMTQSVTASYVYLRQLRDKNRQPFRFRRIGNVGAGPDGHITDHYRLMDSEGKQFSIYIDMYHPENSPLDCKAPKGMFIVQ